MAARSVSRRRALNAAYSSCRTVAAVSPSIGRSGAGVSRERFAHVGGGRGLEHERGLAPAPEGDLVGDRPVASLVPGPGHGLFAGEDAAEAALGLVGETGGLVH